MPSLPKKMLWTELLFRFFPIDKKKFSQQLLSRFLFLGILWFSGLVSYSLNGLTTTYLLALNIYIRNFGMLFLILIGSYYVQHTLRKIIQNFRPMLKMDTSQYQEFSSRLERYTYSFLPCFVIAIIFGFLSGVHLQFQAALAEGLELYVIWNIFFDAFASLLVGTVIWMFASIWLTIFLISRQQLRVKLSQQTITRFRELSMFSLWFGFFYFIGISIGNVSFLTNVQTLTLYEIVISQYLIFVIIGIVGILFPFFNIHNTLLKMKNDELTRISKESENLLHTLDEALEKQASDQTLSVMARLFSLQLKEKQVKVAQEWPIDVSFLSKLIVIGLIPILSRIMAMFLIS